MKVLVIEDEREMLDLYDLAFKRMGHEVILRRDLPTDLTCLPVDVAILDYTLYSRTGMEVLEALRKEQPDIPVIFATAHTHRATLAEMDHAGAFLLRKPFSLASLRETIDRAVGEQ